MDPQCEHQDGADRRSSWGGEQEPKHRACLPLSCEIQSYSGIVTPGHNWLYRGHLTDMMGVRIPRPEKLTVAKSLYRNILNILDAKQGNLGVWKTQMAPRDASWVKRLSVMPISSLPQHSWSPGPWLSRSPEAHMHSGRSDPVVATSGPVSPVSVFFIVLQWKCFNLQFKKNIWIPWKHTYKNHLRRIPTFHS